MILWYSQFLTTQADEANVLIAVGSRSLRSRMASGASRRAQGVYLEEYAFICLATLDSEARCIRRDILRSHFLHDSHCSDFSDHNP